MKIKSVRLPKKAGTFFVTAGIILLSKLKWVISFLKFSKFGATFLSLIVSLAGYAVFFGWQFAAALIYLGFAEQLVQTIIFADRDVISIFKM